MPGDAVKTMNDTTRTCTTCRIGTLHRKTASYAGWHGGGFVVLSSAPVWVCDVCAERTYDFAALEALLHLAGPASPSPDDESAAGARRDSDRHAPDEARTRRRA